MIMTKDDIAQNLRDAGCSAAVSDDFMEQRDFRNVFEQRKILDAQRNILLENIHASQKNLDCLDYLVYRLEKQPRE